MKLSLLMCRLVTCIGRLTCFALFSEGNDLSGSIPTQIGNMVFLEQFQVRKSAAANESLEGTRGP